MLFFIEIIIKLFLWSNNPSKIETNKISTSLVESKILVVCVNGISCDVIVKIGQLGNCQDFFNFLLFVTVKYKSGLVESRGKHCKSYIFNISKSNPRKPGELKLVMES